MEAKFKNMLVGDWVCFLVLGVPVYGKIEYIVARAGGDDRIVATCGECRRADVLEYRPPHGVNP